MPVRLGDGPWWRLGIHWARGGFAFHEHYLAFSSLFLYMLGDVGIRGSFRELRRIFVFHFQGAGSRRLVVTEGSTSGIRSCHLIVFVEVVITVVMY